MPHISILKEMLKGSIIVPIEDHPYKNGKKQVTLTEEGQYSLIIRGLPEERFVIVIKTDKFPAPTNIFNGSKGECKRSDFVIITDIDNKQMVLFIEMKSKKSTEGNQHIIKQFKGAQCVIKYTKEVGKLFWDTPHFLDDFESRFVCLMDINIDKRPTSYLGVSGLHDCPENMLKIKSTHYLQFNQLIGKN